MKAIVQDGYGPPDRLALREVDPPAAGDGEVLVRVHATSVHPDVWHVVTGRPYVLRVMGAGLRRPRNPVPGIDLAGVVTAVGPGVTRFRPGDEVFGETIRGYQWTNGGAFAEFATAPERALAHKPTGVPFAPAAAVATSGLIALHNLRAAGALRPGRRLLVNGAAGGVGTVAVQLARAAGAHVTGVDRTDRLAVIRPMVDRVIDGATEDFTRGDERYDAILDIPGNHPFSRCRRVLTPDGTYVLVGHDGYGHAGRRVLGSVPRVLGLMARAPFTRQLPRLGMRLPPKREALAVLTEHLAAGTLVPVVAATYPLEQVPEALRSLASGEVAGKIVVTV